MNISLLLLVSANVAGIDPKQIQNFKKMSKGRQEEILEVFPLPASARYVSTSACLLAISLT